MNLTLKRLDTSHLDQIIKLQSEVFNQDPNCEKWLRLNTVKTFQEILENDNHVIGHFEENDLISLGVLYDAGMTNESIKKYLTDDESQILNSINLKVVFSSTNYRRCGLARGIIQSLKDTAQDINKETICCTIHPMNSSSKKLFQKFGYQKISKVETSYGVREVWELDLVHNELLSSEN